ncbi:tetraacyldisaccharide 4'-kinase [Flagellimonas aquimarina]|uniref:Tetraacyldisaccharide 4'-kinase n=1 Tax=Flagellimonas aquimarina TaxID=2201895 RepID=A0A316KVB4_9FLAO|nr:tetraacyldisaccharide 4'-kinase [Allomuricauda koreensis]PWL37501.1 tetraacyldisaccharide 4'-kinase [Allomuricauda koreensis]
MQQLLRKIAFPFSLIYALVVYVRNLLYDIGFFKSITYKTPTVCVGNLSVGGTGKTPMIEYLIRLMGEKEVAVLSRGYKRRSKGFLVATQNCSVEDLGDEPFQLYKKFPQITIAVDSDRRNGIEQLQNGIKPEVILLDDAFQHRRVKPSFSILLTAYDNLFFNDWYLPTGNLRDSKLEKKRADIIIVTKCPESLLKDERTSIYKRLKPTKNQKVLFCSLKYANVFKNAKGTIELSVLKSEKIALVTGIASPKPLVSHLKGLDVEFKHFEFSDHHYFSNKEIDQFRDFNIILTTEKDYVRLEGRVENVYYLEVAHHFSDEDHSVLERSVMDLI